MTLNYIINVKVQLLQVVTAIFLFINLTRKKMKNEKLSIQIKLYKDACMMDPKHGYF